MGTHTGTYISKYTNMLTVGLAVCGIYTDGIEHYFFK